MADSSIKDVSDRGSPHYVAYLLLREIASTVKFEDRTKKWVLDTYYDCLSTVNGSKP